MEGGGYCSNMEKLYVCSYGNLSHFIAAFRYRIIGIRDISSPSIWKRAKCKNYENRPCTMNHHQIEIQLRNLSFARLSHYWRIDSGYCIDRTILSQSKDCSIQFSGQNLVPKCILHFLEGAGKWEVFREYLKYQV